MKTIYLDENLSEHVARALNFLNQGYFRDVQVFSTKEKFGKGIEDEIIIPGIGNDDGILITRDFNIQKTRLQNKLCKDYKLGVFFLTMPKNQDRHWEMVKVLINHWEEILHNIGKEKKPFAFRIHVKGKMEKL